MQKKTYLLLNIPIFVGEPQYHHDISWLCCWIAHQPGLRSVESYHSPACWPSAVLQPNLASMPPVNHWLNIPTLWESHLHMENCQIMANHLHRGNFPWLCYQRISMMFSNMLGLYKWANKKLVGCYGTYNTIMYKKEGNQHMASLINGENDDQSDKP